MNENDNLEKASVTAPAAVSQKKRKFPAKGLAIGVAVVLAALVVVAAGLSLAASRAAEDYVDGITTEYSKVTAGKELNCSVKSCESTSIKLRSVPLGEQLSTRYHKVKSATYDYERLVARLRHYTAVTNKFNSLANAANSSGARPVDLGVVAADAEEAAGLIEKFYPSRADEILAMQNISNLAKNSASYNDMADVANSNLTLVQNWLGEERDAIDKMRGAFEKKINS